MLLSGRQNFTIMANQLFKKILPADLIWYLTQIRSCWLNLYSMNIVPITSCHNKMTQPEFKVMEINIIFV